MLVNQMVMRFANFIQESLDSNTLKDDIKSEFSKYKTKDISSRRFSLFVPAKERMALAQKIAKNFDGSLVDQGNQAGKPVVDLPFGLRVFVKPIPGSGVGGTAKEDAQLKSLQKQIEAALADDDVIEIRVKIAGKYYNVAGAETTPGTPKSDFHLLDSKGKEVVWISHKDGSRASHFQQWSGLSRSKEKDIHDHNETKKFVDDVKQNVGDEIPRATTLSRQIVDKKLSNMAVYGNKFGGEFQKNNVTIMLQGPVKLVKRKNFYELTSNHTAVNGEEMTNGYEPYFMAMYKGDRSNFGVKGARFAIQPKASRKSKEI